MRGKRVAAHARSSESVKQCVRHGIELIYHASFADEEALDMLEATKDKHFVAPGIAWLDQHLAPRGRVGHHAGRREDDGLPPRARDRVRDAAEDEASAASASCPAATTASRGSSTAPTRRTSSTSCATSASRRWRRCCGDAARRRDHDARTATSARCAKASSPTCCSSTAIRCRTSRVLQRPRAHPRGDEGRRVPPRARGDAGALALSTVGGVSRHDHVMSSTAWRSRSTAKATPC